MIWKSKIFINDRVRYMATKIKIDEEKLKDMVTASVKSILKEYRRRPEKVFAKHPDFTKECLWMAAQLRNWYGKVRDESWSEEMEEKIFQEFTDIIDRLELLGLREYDVDEKPQIEDNGY